MSLHLWGSHQLPFHGFTTCDHSDMLLFPCHFDKCFQLTSTAIPDALMSTPLGGTYEMLFLLQGSLITQSYRRPYGFDSTPTSERGHQQHLMSADNRALPEAFKAILRKKKKKKRHVPSPWDSQVSSWASASYLLHSKNEAWLYHYVLYYLFIAVVQIFFIF